MLAEHQEETLRAIRDRDDLVFQSVKNSVGPEARPTERWVAVVDFVFQGALECIAIARVMRKEVAEIRRLAEMRFLYSRKEGGQLKVERAIIN